MNDFIIVAHGSISLLFPKTYAAQAWVEDHLPADAMTFGKGVVIEHRYVGDIVDGIIDDGLQIEGA